MCHFSVWYGEVVLTAGADAFVLSFGVLVDSGRPRCSMEGVVGVSLVGRISRCATSVRGVREGY